MVGSAADGVGRHLQGVGQRRGRREAQTAHRPGVAADDDDPAEVLEGVGAPVPHVEGVDPVIGVAGAVQVAVPLVGGEALLVGLLDLDRVGGGRQDLLEEVDVRRMVDGMEGPRRRVGQDGHPALRAPAAGPGTG